MIEYQPIPYGPLWLVGVVVWIGVGETIWLWVERARQAPELHRSTED